MKYFGTDGIRQKSEQFTPEFLAKIVKGLVDYAGDEVKVLIGGDTRESTEWILSDLESALETFGVDYGNVGILPTPAINYCFFEMGFDFAIDVTASHNSYVDNGIKIFERGEKTGQKLSEKGCEIIEKALKSTQEITLTSPTLREDLHDEAVLLYKAHLASYIGPVDFKNLKIAIDCADGATSVIGDSLFKEFGASTYLIHADDHFGTKINDNCGSTHLESLQEQVTKNHLDFGIAYDGDGDRCLMIDGEGNTIDGDQIIAIFTNYLNLDKIAITVMANQGLLNWAKDAHINTEITPVGDTNVAIAMKEKDIKLGGEQSGHIILPGQTTGDGILTSLMMAKIISETKSTLHDLASIITKFPQIILNMDATKAEKEALSSTPAQELLKTYETKLESVSGRLLVRPSGTEDLIRITMWGNDEQAINKLATSLKDELKGVL